MRALSILVVDDHEEVRKGIRALLSERADWLICGEASDGIEAIEKAKRLRPDVILMDIAMPRMQGIEATRIIRQEVPESDVIIVSQNDFGLIHKAAAEAGAAGFVDKSRLRQDLLKTIEALAKNVTGHGPDGRRSTTIDPQVVNLDNLSGTGLLARETANLLRKVFMQSPAAIGLLSGPEHRWTFVNAEIHESHRSRSSRSTSLARRFVKACPNWRGKVFSSYLIPYTGQVPHTSAPQRKQFSTSCDGPA